MAVVPRDLTSDLRPLISDIVKRVVTVKQVQPFRLAGPGHGYAKTPGREPWRDEAYASASEVRDQRSEIRRRARRRRPGAPVLTSDL
jgi:hypothetical protein